MVDTKSPGDKTLSVPTKTLTLKPRVETGTVRQSFSHGRTKQVVVEKRGKRRVGGDAPAAESHAPEPVVAKAASRPSAKPPKPAARPKKNATGRTRRPSARPSSKPRNALAKPKPRPQRRFVPPRRCPPRALPALPPTSPTRMKARARSG